MAYHAVLRGLGTEAFPTWKLFIITLVDAPTLYIK